MAKPELTPKEQRMFRKRVIAFLVVHGIIALHLIAWYLLDWKVIGALEMQELFRNFIEKNVLTTGALFFLFFIVTGALWGRLFCGWMCHIGQTYDLLAVWFKKLRIPTNTFPLRFGGLMTWAILIWYFLWEAVVNRVRTPPNELETAWGATTPWELLPGWLNGTLTLGMVLLILPVILGRRAFCRTLCPWGALLGAANRISFLKIRRTGNCTMCGSCDLSCPMDVEVSREINTRFHVSSLACTNCMACTAACPTNALQFTTAGRENREPQKRPFLPKLPYPPLAAELAFWIMTGVVGYIYAELYGIGVFPAFTMGLILARLTWMGASALRKNRTPRMLAPTLALILVWAVVARDGVADFHYDRGRAAFLKGNYPLAQHHYEKSDELLWETPNLLIYHLYIIYKNTGQEEKRQALYDRYDQRRQDQNKH